MHFLIALIMVSCQDRSTKEIDDGTEFQRIAVIVSVLAQAERIPPEFAEKAEEKVRAMPPTALPHLLKLMNKLEPETKQRLSDCGQSIVRQAKEQSVEIPESYLQKFAENSRQDTAARRAALRWLDLLNPGTERRFLIQHISDDTFRDDAIDACLETTPQQNNEDPSVTVQMLRTAFKEVRDLDRGRRLTEALKAHGIVVSPENQLGVVTQWNCETILKSAVSIESQSASTTSPGSSSHILLRRDSSDLLTHVIFRRPPLNCPVVLRSVMQSDVERNVQVRITCNSCPRVHVNGEEIALLQHDSDAGRIRELDEYTKSLHLLRGKNEIALKFENADLPAEPRKDETSSDICFCVRIVDDNGKGLHEPQLTSHLVPETAKPDEP